MLQRAIDLNFSRFEGHRQQSLSHLNMIDSQSFASGAVLPLIEKNIVSLNSINGNMPSTPTKTPTSTPEKLEPEDVMQIRKVLNHNGHLIDDLEA